MDQQIKSNNKNNESQAEPVPIKIAFQANILKYVQKKKRQFSFLSDLSEKYKTIDDKDASASSNLINRKTDYNFYKNNQEQNVPADTLLSIRIKLSDRKPTQSSTYKKKIKGHKSSLSDWRVLYDDRQQIKEKHEMKKICPDKMAVTDRLFYPSQKQTVQRLESINCKKAKIQNEEKIRDESSQQKYFVSDQNFLHMYHRSKAPIAVDISQKKRIAKYLKENKQRRESNNGLRLMNEGIFNNTLGNDVSFIPYKFQNSNSNSKLRQALDQDCDVSLLCLQSEQSKNIRKVPNFSQQIRTLSQNNRSITFNKAQAKNKTQIRKFLSKVKQEVRHQTKYNFQDQEVNPQHLQPKQSIQIDEKLFINSSDICSRTIMNDRNRKLQNTQFELKMFKTRRNKIEKGIFNVKNVKSQNKFANFQSSFSSPKNRKTSLNWNKTNKFA